MEDTAEIETDRVLPTDMTDTSNDVGNDDITLIDNKPKHELSRKSILDDKLTRIGAYSTILWIPSISRFIIACLSVSKNNDYNSSDSGSTQVYHEETIASTLFFMIGIVLIYIYEYMFNGDKFRYIKAVSGFALIIGAFVELLDLFNIMSNECRALSEENGYSKRDLTYCNVSTLGLGIYFIAFPIWFCMDILKEYGNNINIRMSVHSFILFFGVLLWTIAFGYFSDNLSKTPRPDSFNFVTRHAAVIGYIFTILSMICTGILPWITTDFGVINLKTPYLKKIICYIVFIMIYIGIPLSYFSAIVYPNNLGGGVNLRNPSGILFLFTGLGLMVGYDVTCLY